MPKKQISDIDLQFIVVFFYKNKFVLAFYKNHNVAIQVLSTKPRRGDIMVENYSH